MKTSTVLILAGAGLVVVYIATRPKTTLPLASSSNFNGGSWGNLGALLGGTLIGAAGTLKQVTPGPVSSSSGGYSAAGVGSNGDSEVAIVKSLDAGGIASYDAQGDVYGIAGIDY